MRNRWLFSLGHLVIPVLLIATVSSVPFRWTMVLLIVLHTAWPLLLVRLSKSVPITANHRMLHLYMVLDSILIGLILFIPGWNDSPRIWLSQSILLLYAVEFGFRPSLKYGSAMILLSLLAFLHAGHSAAQIASELFPFVLVAASIAVIIGKVTDKLHQLAYYDPLTSLPNRLHMKESLQQTIDLANTANEKAAVLFFDLDSFKHVNDSLGHEAGDELLQQVAKRMKQRLPDHVVLGRMGGDEFTVVIGNYSHLDDVQNVAESIVDSFREPFPLSGHSITITSSIGISLYPQHARYAATLMKYTDAAMYNAKRFHNHYEFFSTSHVEGSEERLLLEADLNGALDRGEFELYYQPQIKNGTIIGFEALIRWNHPIRGMIPPASFIPLAERRGQILAIGDWVLLTACRQFKEMLDEGQLLGRIAVNISVNQFYQPHFIGKIAAALQQTGLEARYLQLEITESLAMKNITYFIETLNELHELGIKISIDDFGTGYSSFNYLCQFPIDALKIDRSFIWNMDKGDKHISVVGSIIRLASALQLDVVAEGVETLEQDRLLQEMGCSVAQGYLFSRPVPFAQAKELLEKARTPQQASAV